MQRENHDKKFLRLIGTKPSDKSGSNLKKRWVKNLSSKELSELERKVLEHGLKFAVVPNRIQTAEIIAAVEEGIFPLDDDAKRLVRAEVSSILRRAKIPPKTLIRMFSKLYLVLKKIRTGLFFQQTKAIVLLLWTNMIYREKALSLLNDRNMYSILKSDPTGKTQKSFKRQVTSLEQIKSNIISKATYEKLYSSDGLSPRFYGLPKIHKPEFH